MKRNNQKRIGDPFPLVAALALFACACSSVTTPVDLRIQQRSAAFAELNAEQQERTRLGHIQVGDTADMLWMAFGEPADLQRAEEPPREMWAYVRELNPRASGSQPPLPVYQPGAMFAANPPPPPKFVRKIYIITDGVITGMETKDE